jgi:hypothetical protein
VPCSHRLPYFDPEFGEPRLPGVLEAGGCPPAGDDGAVLVAFGAVLAAEPVAPAAFPAPAGVAAEDAPELEFLASRFALRSARFDFVVLVSAPVVALVSAAPVVALVPAPVVEAALLGVPAAGLVTGDVPSAFELSGRPPPVSTLRPCWVR